jgi:hypothetical protein
MKRISWPTRLTLTLLAPLGLALPGVAQQPPLELKPFKATLMGNGEGLTLPVSPPIVSQHLSGTGQADLLGQFTFVEHAIVHLGPDGMPLSFTDGVEVLTAANGDAIFLSYSGLPRPTTAPGGFIGEMAFTIAGGRGRFAGATGSGVMTSMATAAPPKVSFTRTLEGTITAPKP